jgi:hypothetical protein
MKRSIFCSFHQNSCAIEFSYGDINLGLPGGNGGNGGNRLRSTGQAGPECQLFRFRRVMNFPDVSDYLENQHDVSSTIPPINVFEEIR